MKRWMTSLLTIALLLSMSTPVMAGNGVIYNTSTGVIRNFNTINNTGSITNDGHIANSGLIGGAGSLLNYSGTIINNIGGSISAAISGTAAEDGTATMTRLDTAKMLVDGFGSSVYVMYGWTSVS